MNKFVTATFIFVLIGSLSLIRCKTTGKNILPLTKSWEKAIPQQEIPQGLTSLSAKYCATCHLKHYQEWLLSTHAHAWSDLQFQSELKKESSPFYVYQLPYTFAKPARVYHSGAYRWRYLQTGEDHQ
ncbi:MAG: hypothetical protein IPG82_19465 [Saprospiraceae bacterium]|nr:hypothetical protein [Saprospiraceae bacterium]